MIKTFTIGALLISFLVSASGAQSLSDVPRKLDLDARVDLEAQILDLATQCEQAGLTDMAAELRNIGTEGAAPMAVTNGFITCPRCSDGDPLGECPTCTGAPACICCANHMRCCTYTHGSPKRCRTKCVYDTWYCP